MANLIIDIGSLSVKAAWAEGVELARMGGVSDEEICEMFRLILKGE